MRTTFRSRASALERLNQGSANTERSLGADLGCADDANLILLEDKVLPSEEIQAICKRHDVRARVVDPESGLLVREFGRNGILSTPRGK